jgi:hypothetical protein
LVGNFSGALGGWGCECQRHCPRSKIKALKQDSS